MRTKKLLYMVIQSHIWILIIMFSINSAESADWVLYTKSLADGYYDRSRIEYLPNERIKIWSKGVYPWLRGENAPNVILSLMELDCSKSEWRFLTIYRYNERGKLLSEVKEPSQRVPVGDPDLENLFRILCTERPMRSR
jgi:hypothetical protein